MPVCPALLPTTHRDAPVRQWQQWFFWRLLCFLLLAATWLHCISWLRLAMGNKPSSALAFCRISLGLVFWVYCFQHPPLSPFPPPARRGQYHISLMTPRRWNQAVTNKSFTVFVLGVSGSSIPIIVQGSTTGNDLKHWLQSRGLLPCGSSWQTYLTHERQLVSGTDTMSAQGIGDSSHLSLRCRYLGGSRNKRKRDEVDDSDARPKKPQKGKGGRPTNASKLKRSRENDDDVFHEDTTPPPSLAPVPETPESKLPLKVVKFSPRTRRTVTFALSTMTFSDDEYDSDQVPVSRRQTSKRRQTQKSDPRFKPLNKVKRSKSDGWQTLGSTSTSETYQYFESSKNDYGPHRYQISDQLVEIQYLGHPLDRPQDIRARPFMLSWITDDRSPPKSLRNKPRPIYRATYKCLGNCSALDVPKAHKKRKTDRQPHSSDSGSDYGSNSESESESPSSSESSSSATTRSCSSKVQLQLEVCSDDLGKVIVYQRGRHGPAPNDSLQISQYIRQCIIEYAMLANMTAGRIKRRLTKAYTTFNTPLFRRPTSAQVENMVANIRRAERLDTDPLLSIGIFADKNPDKIFYYRSADLSTSPPSAFATGIKSEHSLQSLLLWGNQNGIGLDSCWRHKNENRAPVTFVTTIDHNRRMLPGPVYVSANVTTETLTTFLNQVKILVEKMARSIVRGAVGIHPSHAKFANELRVAARRVESDSNGWVPLFVMIDKSRAELNALIAVWPQICVRLCQFHVIQAVLRWEQDARSPTARPQLSRTAKDLLLHAVRELQRCKTAEDWSAALRVFKTRVAILSAHKHDTVSLIMDYFTRNWFSEEWRDLWTDMGLPAGHNRDRISTNNWTERAFKTFDQIFLENRANKSAYRLVVIIANEWFSFFENWQYDKPRFDATEFKIAERGHRLWNSGKAVIPQLEDHKGRRVWRVANPEALGDDEGESESEKSQSDE